MVEENKVRLTEEDNGSWRVRGIEWEQLRTGKTITREMGKTLYEAFWKLKEYENTGLTPEEIKAMIELVSAGIPQPVADYIAKDFK